MIVHRGSHELSPTVSGFSWGVSVQGWPLSTCHQFMSTPYVPRSSVYIYIHVHWQRERQRHARTHIHNLFSRFPTSVSYDFQIVQTRRTPELQYYSESPPLCMHTPVYLSLYRSTHIYTYIHRSIYMCMYIYRHTYTQIEALIYSGLAA